MLNKKGVVLFAVWLIIISFVLSTLLAVAVYSDTTQFTDPTDEKAIQAEELITITISAAGDVTMGRDALASYNNSFDNEFELQKRDYSYFMKNVKPIFENDDLTLINLEGPLTNSTIMAEKQYRFKGAAAYTGVLKQGSIEAVNLANNHMFDYLEQGYWDTVSNLSEADIGYFGFEHRYLREVKGIKVGMLGFTGWDSGAQKKKDIKKAVDDLKSKGADLVIINFHWGEELSYTPNKIQKELGRYSIDVGADLVLGHHPHVIQGIETYKGKSIVYSLGNFSFGGNKNPADKDAFIYQHSFSFKDKVLQMETGQVIPISISSVKNRNNYQPTPFQGAEAIRVMNKIRSYSMNLNK